MDRKEIVAKATEFAAMKENIERDAVAQQQIRDFLSRYPYKEKPELLRTMTPDDLYFSKANDRFFDWLDKGTDHVGNFRIHDAAVYAEAVKRMDFFKVVLTVLVSEKRSISFKIDQNWGVIPGFGEDKLIAKKLLSLYYSENVVPVFSTEELERMCSSLGINYNSISIQRFRKNYSALTVGQKFELLNFGLIGFRSAHLSGWTNTQFVSFLYQQFLPAAVSSPPVQIQEVREATAATTSQKEIAKTIQLYEARLKLAEKTIQGLRSEVSQKENRAKQAEESLRSKEEEIRKREEGLSQREELMRQELAKAPRETIDSKASEEEVAKAIQLYETRLKVAETTIKELKSEVEQRIVGARQAEESLRLKEEEIAKREEDLNKRQDEMRQELEQMEESRRQEAAEQGDLSRTVEELNRLLSEKDEKIEAMEKEVFLNKNVIKVAESDFMDGEVGVFKEPSPSETDIVKVKTGTPRLDDLLIGGIPMGAQVVVYGPAFIGKEIAMDAFAASSITSGIPVIWVTTDKTIEEIRAEMSFLLDDFEEYEKKGMVYFVDAYSRIVGDSSVSKNASYLDDGSEVESISTMVDRHLSKIKGVVKEKGYRLIFRSISSLSANHDIKSIFAMLRQFTAKRRKDGCVATYSIEKGIMSEQDLQIISSIMDGVMEFTTDGKSNFLSIQGICETQTRNKVQYSATKNGLTIGSFFLGRIR